MAITRPLLVLVSALAQQHAITAPNPRPPTEQLRKQYGFEHAVPHTVALVRILSFIWATFEFALLLALSDHCPRTLARPIRALLGPSLVATTDPSTLTPAFLASSCLILSGALLRAYCYRTLGTRFTFELAIRPAHALVTDGAYGIVRHPSYTGALFVVLGALVYLLDWPFLILVRVCGSTPLDDRGLCRMVTTGVLTCVCGTALWLVSVVFGKRMDKEDAMLEENFGEAWQTWARRVPWRLIPGLY